MADIIMIVLLETMLIELELEISEVRRLKYHAGQQHIPTEVDISNNTDDELDE